MLTVDVSTLKVDVDVSMLTVDVSTLKVEMLLKMF
jgi:hypothetical protein